MTYIADLRSKVDDNNSVLNTTLSPSASLTGTCTDIIEYESISVLIDGTSVGPAPGDLKLQFSQDAGVTISRRER
jgi:hypothetical protein